MGSANEIRRMRAGSSMPERTARSRTCVAACGDRYRDSRVPLSRTQVRRQFRSRTQVFAYWCEECDKLRILQHPHLVLDPPLDQHQVPWTAVPDLIADPTSHRAGLDPKDLLGRVAVGLGMTARLRARPHNLPLIPG